MQFQVPQFIETEDKVVGPFSLRQFMYIGVAIFISAIFYFFVQTWLFVIVAIILVGLAGVIAFVKVNGQPVVKIITSAANFYWKPQTYVWKSESAAVQVAGAGRKFAAHHEGGVPLEEIASGLALHKSWEGLQTGTKAPERKTVERKLNSRYQILERVTGDRQAAKRVDYR
jgi:hypothetical protein